PIGRTSARSPFQMPRRLASLSAARRATSSFAMVWSITCRPARAGLSTFPSWSNTGSRGGTDHSLRRCVMLPRRVVEPAVPDRAEAPVLFAGDGRAADLRDAWESRLHVALPDQHRDAQHTVLLLFGPA